MKKLILAFFLMAFTSVSFSATSLDPVKKVIKKEIVKNSENQIVADVQENVIYGSSKFVSPVNSTCSKPRAIFVQAKTIGEKGFYYNSIHYSYCKKRLNQNHNYNTENTNISG